MMMSKKDVKRLMFSFLLFKQNRLPATSLATLMALLLSACGGGGAGDSESAAAGNESAAAGNESNLSENDNVRYFDSKDGVAAVVFFDDDVTVDSGVYLRLSSNDQTLQLSEVAMPSYVTSSLAEIYPSYSKIKMFEYKADNADSDVRLDSMDSVSLVVPSNASVKKTDNETVFGSGQHEFSRETVKFITGQDVDSTVLEWLQEFLTQISIADFFVGYVEKDDGSGFSAVYDEETESLVFSLAMPSGQITEVAIEASSLEIDFSDLSSQLISLDDDAGFDAYLDKKLDAWGVSLLQEFLTQMPVYHWFSEIESEDDDSVFSWQFNKQEELLEVGFSMPSGRLVEASVDPSSWFDFSDLSKQVTSINKEAEMNAYFDTLFDTKFVGTVTAELMGLYLDQMTFESDFLDDINYHSDSYFFVDKDSIDRYYVNLAENTDLMPACGFINKDEVEIDFSDVTFTLLNDDTLLENYIDEKFIPFAVALDERADGLGCG
jgi:hypothetical protein